jgi:hypothetical protein
MMVWVLLITTAAVTVLSIAGIIAVILRLAPRGSDFSEASRIEAAVRLAERQLYDTLRATFQAMLEQARAHDVARVKK